MPGEIPFPPGTLGICSSRYSAPTSTCRCLPDPTYVAAIGTAYQRQFAGSWLASVSYLGNKTTHLWIAGETDPAEYLGTGSCTIAGVSYKVCSTTSIHQPIAKVSEVLMNPAAGSYYASIDTMDDGAVAHYEGLVLSIAHRFSQIFQINTNFTDSYCLSDYDFGAALAGSTNSQLFNRHADWGPCVSDTRYNFNFSAVAVSAFHSSNSFVSHLLNNWQLAPLMHASSGQPLLITSGKDNTLTGLGNDRPNQRLAYTGTVDPTCSSQAICVQWLNPAAFVPNPVGTYGNVGRNAERGPGAVHVRSGAEPGLLK